MYHITKIIWKELEDGYKLTVEALLDDLQAFEDVEYRYLSVHFEKEATTPENICDTINTLIKQLND